MCMCVIRALLGIGNGFSHVYLRSEPHLRTRQHRSAGRHHSAHAQRMRSTVASRGRAPGSHSLFWPAAVYLSNGPSKRVAYTPSPWQYPPEGIFLENPPPAMARPHITKNNIGIVVPTVEGLGLGNFAGRIRKQNAPLAIEDCC